MAAAAGAFPLNGNVRHPAASMGMSEEPVCVATQGCEDTASEPLSTTSHTSILTESSDAVCVRVRMRVRPARQRSQQCESERVGPRRGPTRTLGPMHHVYVLL